MLLTGALLMAYFYSMILTDELAERKEEEE